VNVRGAGVHAALLASAFAVLVAAQSDRSPAPARIPSTGGPDSCTTSGCHADVVAHRFVHGPVNLGCDACHRVVDEAAHRFALVAAEADLCRSCHADSSVLDGAHVHAPVAAGACTDCHDPHGAADPGFLGHASAADLCRSCHDDAGFEPGRHAGHDDCTRCHLAHTSDHASLLADEKAGLCMTCHADTVTTPPPSDDDPAPDGPVVVHEVVAGSCDTCHAMHDATHPALLAAPTLDLCLDCHRDQVARGPEGGVHAHARPGERACASCHEPHVSRHEKLLTAPAETLCLGCHAREIVRPDGSALAAMLPLDRDDLHVHVPVTTFGCAFCHDAHGGTGTSLLHRAFPAGLYHPFDFMSYAACFDCHDTRAFTEATTTTATGFRDGDRNLHHLHVTAPGGNGRSCRVCHDTHATVAPKLMREETRYGRWRIPIRFEATETGGGCAAGCHRAESYDRGG
jgi:predicted CXXCH cytochrome family protein